MDSIDTGSRLPGPVRLPPRSSWVKEMTRGVGERYQAGPAMPMPSALAPITSGTIAITA
ncbi:hypothetical protein [Nocardia farcinica]|uniref:hypothetical protein n=1 Tax=Nocardia farcinica TaxID=37329 RepID=UPI002453BDD9|nr:hypothetical protein [Nocardia farcinica]